MDSINRTRVGDSVIEEFFWNGRRIVYSNNRLCKMGFSDIVELHKTARYPCKVCGKSFDIECDPHEFDPNNHYCGGSPSCVP